MDYYSADNWHVDANSTLSSEHLQEIERYLENNGYIAVLHSHFCAARGATPRAYENFEDFRAYLAREAKPGDIIEVWPFPTGDRLFGGKIPNEKGQVPKNGAY